MESTSDPTGCKFYPTQEQRMAAYVINQFDIYDLAKYKEYQKVGAPTIGKHGGHALAAGGKIEDFEGNPAFPGGVTPRVVILEFPTFEQAKNWYLSPEYQEAVRLRNLCARSRVFIVDGVPPQTMND
jgi:uncharacterized protein (DUF1330 family)